MANLSATLTYDPRNSSWSIDNDPIHVPPGGSSTITWTIELASGATGAIKFAAQRAIQFDPGWNGGEPSGNDSSWSVTVNNSLAKGNNPVEYEYGVRALYQAQGNSNWTPIHLDPEVEEDPPSTMLHA